MHALHATAAVPESNLPAHVLSILAAQQLILPLEHLHKQRKESKLAESVKQ
jgi:hypothetical protein